MNLHAPAGGKYRTHPPFAIAGNVASRPALSCIEGRVNEPGFEQLLERAQRLDPDALRSLIEAYSPRVYGLVYRLTGCRDAAEDLLQATFLRVVRMLPAYRHSDRFDAWLFRIAANLVRDRARSNERRRRAFGTPAPGSPDDRARWVPDPRDDGPAEHLERREGSARLAKSLEKLPEIDRQIVILRHYAELPFREIASVLDIPLGTALSRAHRALARLRADLGVEE